MRKLVCAVLIVISPLLAGADEYFVDPENGSDGNAGTLAAPWQTVSFALSAASPVVAGDSVTLRGGIYRESVAIAKSGNGVDGPITVRAYGDEVAIMNGASPLDGWQQAIADDPYLIAVAGATEYPHPNATSLYWTRVPADSFPSVLSNTVILVGLEHARIASLPDQSAGYGEDPTEFQPVDPECYGQDDYLYDAQLTQDSGYWQARPGYWEAPFVRTLVYAMNNNVAESTIATHTRLPAYGQITFADPLGYDLSNGGSRDDAYRIVNHPHALDSPGEFYVSAIESVGGQEYRRVYFWPEAIGDLDGAVAMNDLGSAFLRGAGGADYIIIEGLTMVGYAGHTVAFAPPDQGTDLVVRGCTILNGGGHGIYTLRVDHALVEGNAIRRCADRGAIMIDGDRCTIRGNDSRENGSTNLSFYSVTNSMMIGNTVGGQRSAHGNGTSCYGVSSMIENLLVANNTYFACNSSFQNVRNVVLFGNIYHIDDEHLAWPVNNWVRAHGLMGHDGYFLYAHNTVYDARYPSTEAVYHAVNLRPPADDYGPTGGEDGPVASWYLYNNVFHGIGGYADEDWPNGSPKQRVVHDFNIHTWYMWQQRPTYGWANSDNEFECLIHDTPWGSAADCILDGIFEDPVYAAGDWRPLAGGPAEGTGTDIQPLLASLGIPSTFPEYDFSRDLSGLSWNNPPSIGALEYGGIFADGFESSTPVEWATVVP